jgi:hypothetical protein
MDLIIVIVASCAAAALARLVTVFGSPRNWPRFSPLSTLAISISCSILLFLNLWGIKVRAIEAAGFPVPWAYMNWNIFDPVTHCPTGGFQYYSIFAVDLIISALFIPIIIAFVERFSQPPSSMEKPSP